MESISLDQVLKHMERVDSKGNPVPFTVTAVTCDINRNTGGERPTYNAVLCSPGLRRKAYSHRNDIRFIKNVNSAYPASIHPLLITKFNGKTVYI
jgi:hypothetical protein